jgi:hypothetical protein
MAEIRMDLNLMAWQNIWSHISVSVSLSLHITKCYSVYDLVSMEFFTSISW